MLIHAFKRKEPITVDFTPRGSLTERLVHFFLNDQKAVVADVSDDDIAQRLLSIPEAYREYEVSKPMPVIPTPLAPEQLQARAEQDARVVAESERIAKGAGTTATDLIHSRDQGVNLIGSSTLGDVINLTGSKTITAAELLAATYEKFRSANDGAGVDAWNALEAEQREALLIEEKDRQEEAAEEAEEKTAEALREQMAADQKAADERKAAVEAAAAAKFTLVNGDQRIDLKTMDDKELRDFAKKYEVALPAKVKGDQIRQVIVDALAPEGSDQAAVDKANKVGAGV